MYAGAARLYLLIGLGTLPNILDEEGVGGESELFVGMCLYSGAGGMARLYLLIGLGTLPNILDGEGVGGESELFAGMCLYSGAGGMARLYLLGLGGPGRVGAGGMAARAVTRMAEAIRHCNIIKF